MPYCCKASKQKIFQTLFQTNISDTSDTNICRQKRRKRRPQSLFFLFLFKNGSVTPLNGLGVLLEVETPEFVLWYGILPKRRGKCICLAFSIYLLEQPLLYLRFNYFKTYLFYLEYFLWLVLLIYI